MHFLRCFLCSNCKVSKTDLEVKWKKDTSCLVLPTRKLTAVNISKKCSFEKVNNWDSHGWRCRQAACVSPLNIHFDLLQSVIVERSGNHSYKESLPVTSSWVAQITEVTYTKAKGTKLTEIKSLALCTWAVVGSWQESLYCMWPNLGTKMTLCFWKMFKYKRRKSVFTYHPEQRFSRWTTGVWLKEHKGKTGIS